MKGLIYQGIQLLLDYKREVTWGNTVATFGDTDKNVFGHEFGHIIQFNTQGWATFQGRGIFEQILMSITSRNPYYISDTNEYEAEWYLKSVGGRTY